MVDKPLMVFALILKLIILMFLCVETAVLHFDECTTEEKALILFIYCNYFCQGEQLLILASLHVLAMANFIHCMKKI